MLELKLGWDVTGCDSGYIRIRDLIVSVPDHCLSFYLTPGRMSLDVIVDIDRYTNNLNVRVDTWVGCHWM